MKKNLRRRSAFNLRKKIIFIYCIWEKKLRVIRQGVIRQLKELRQREREQEDKEVAEEDLIYIKRHLIQLKKQNKI